MSDHQPDSFRPDLYDLIEIEAPPGVPLPRWFTDDFVPCMDCRANMFLRWVILDPSGYWDLTIAHDDGCPTNAAIERGLSDD